MSKQYCTDCKTITKHSPKLSAVMEDKLVCGKCSKMNGFCTLLKEGDEYFKKFSKDIRWIKWDEKTLKAKKLYKTPKVGYSLLMSPFNMFFTWQTTPITDILEKTNRYIHFKTQNSEYKLYFNKKALKEYFPKN